MKIAIIAGTGIDETADFRSGRQVSVQTRFGEAFVIETELGGTEVMFVPRHGRDHSLAPAAINYRAQVAALRKLEVTRVLAVCAVGSLKGGMSSGSFAVLSDFIDVTCGRVDTFFDDPGAGVVHTDFTHPYCPEVSRALREACEEQGVEYRPEAVYVGVNGPRYESPAEVRLYASWGGDVIGMTGLPEAVLAREAGLCYGAVAIVTNPACGMSPTPLSHEQVRSAAYTASENLTGVLRHAIAGIPTDPKCACGSNRALVL
jgi:5'-methylthioadenosine phosphorylase